jgi:hypothetical protein
MSPPNDPRDPVDPAALLGEVQRLGELAATRVAEQFSQLLRVGNEAASGATDGARPADPHGDELADALRTARAEAERALDGAAVALSRAIDGYARVVEAALSHAGAMNGHQPDEPVTVVVRDGHGSAACWIHHTASTPGDAVALRMGPLISAAGDLLAATIDITPATIEPMAPGSSRELRLTVSVDGTSPDGRYHGLLLGSPGELTLRVVVDIESPTDPTNRADG